MPKVKKVGIKKSRTENALSTFNPERKMLAYKNKINRWMCLLNSGENINVSFLKILSEIEENIMNRIELLQSRIPNLINNSDESDEFDKSDEFYKRDFLKDLEELGIELPIKNLSTFTKFNEELEKDSEKKKALKCYMYSLIDSGENLNKDISKIMRNILTTDIQKHYSGYGRIFKGRRKLNYSETNAYLCMQGVLTNKYKKSSNQLKILPAVSRWLSQYRDRLPRSQRQYFKNSESEESSDSYSE